MPYCEFCGEQIGYLPFTCKYCGGTYCTKHRLPENHECTFELKHVPVSPTPTMDSRKRYQDVVLKKSDSREYLDQGPKVLKKYLKRQDKQRKKTLKTFGRSQKTAPKYNYTKILFSIIIITSIVALIFDYFGISQFIYLSLNGVIRKFAFHTFFSSLFISFSSSYFTLGGAIINLFFLGFMMFFLYFMARNIEFSYGASHLFKLYFISGLFSVLFYALLRIVLSLYYPIVDYPVYVGLAWGGIYGLISFIIFPMMNKKIRALMTFVPMRLSGKSFLIMIIAIRLLFGLIYSAIDPLSILYYFPELGGILGSFIYYKYKFLRR